MEFGQKKFFVKLIYFISRVFFALDFFKFSGPLCQTRIFTREKKDHKSIFLVKIVDNISFFRHNKNMQERLPKKKKKTDGQWKYFWLRVGKNPKKSPILGSRTVCIKGIKSTGLFFNFSEHSGSKGACGMKKKNQKMLI